MNIKIYKFKELSVKLLHDIIKLRLDVFMIEQKCFYQDLDGYDFNAIHVCFLDKNNEKLIGYTRIIKPKIKFEEASITRVVVSNNYRKIGIARKLMEQSIAFILSDLKCKNIRIEAQAYLVDFYISLKFKKLKPINIDNIPHYEMLYNGSE